MREEQLKKSLSELAKETTETIRTGLAEDIKQHIPRPLNTHKRGMDTINIIIDLRINKLAAAAIIIMTMILLASFFSGRGSPGNNIYQDSKMLIAYFLQNHAEKSELLAVKSRYEHLLGKGEQAVYYGDNAKLNDYSTVLLQWKLPDGNFKVITGDLQEKIVSAEQLIELLSNMLQKK
jgi:hypothetical protein